MYAIARRSPRVLYADLKKVVSPEGRRLTKKARRKAEAQRIGDILRGGVPGRRRVHESNRAYRKRVEAEKSVLNAWLQYQFALRPLMMDLDAAGASLSYWRFERNLPLRLTVKKGAQRVHRAVYSNSQLNFGPRVGSVKQTYRVAVTSRCHYSGTFEVTPSSDRTLAQLGLANPASVAWELCLFSWMVDYGLKVGDWLKSMTKLDHCKWVEGSVSRLAVVTTLDGSVELQKGPPPSSNDVREVKGSGQCALECGRFSRQVLTSTPLPAAFPVPRSSLGITQMANAMAALAGLNSTRSLRI